MMNRDLLSGQNRLAREEGRLTSRQKNYLEAVAQENVIEKKKRGRPKKEEGKGDEQQLVVLKNKKDNNIPEKHYMSN